MKKNTKSSNLKQKLLGYIQASRIEGGMIEVVFLMLGYGTRIKVFHCINQF